MTMIRSSRHTTVQRLFCYLSVLIVWKQAPQPHQQPGQQGHSAFVEAFVSSVRPSLSTCLTGSKCSTGSTGSPSCRIINHRHCKGRNSLFVLARQEHEEVTNDEMNYYDDGDEDGFEEATEDKTSSSRWENLNQRIKDRIVKEGQERAIANKQKREPVQDKKRRMMMYFKEKQREKKQASKVRRPLPFDQRTPLSALIPGMNVTGTVISLTKYGAYVDVGSQCDGLLHVSQITNEFFVEHPKQVLTPGQEVTVAIRSVNAEKKKLHLTMLPSDVVQAEQIMMSQQEQEDRIPLEDIFVDDELWGELRRVTDYGAYVEVGAVVHGWLHFMDHPAFGWSQNGEHPSTYMKVGDRVRVWVADVDPIQKRIKLTANRPTHLPGPRRAM